MTKIAVVVPYYNFPEKAQASVNSIKEDGNNKIDVVIIDDGSKDKLDIKLIANYRYGIIKLITFKENKGQNFARNAALEWIAGKDYTFTAFLDAGDYCLPNRIREQVNYLINNPDVKLLGSQVNFVDMQRKFLYTTNLPVSYKDLKNKFYLNSQIYQPAAMIRNEILSSVGYFSPDFRIAPDYEYFFRILKKYKVENLDMPLIDYVVDDNSISSTKRKQQVKTRIKVIKKHFYFGYYPVYGLLRNIFLLFVSRRVTTFLKQLLYK
jgi:glycosyltransferase involved in cell wall biosynthesis